MMGGLGSLGCCCPGAEGATSVNGATGAISIGVGVQVADRAALALLDAAALPGGSTARVLDLGNGQAVTYYLQLDARAADAKLRITALNKAGYLWVAGDGVLLPASFLSPSIDLMAIDLVGVTWIPALAGFYFTGFNSIKCVIVAKTGTATGNPSMSAGNNAGGLHRNIMLGATPTAAAIESAATDANSGGAPPNFASAAYASAGTGVYTDLTDPVLIRVNTPATGPSVLRIKYHIGGYLLATETFAP